VLDADLKVISANRSFYQTFKVDHKETQGRFIYDLGNRQWDIPRLRELLENVLLKNKAFDDYEIEHDFEAIGPKTMLFNARRLATMQMILITIEDITEWKRIERELAQAKEKQYMALIENLPEKIFFKDINSVYVSCNKNYASDFKIKPEEIAGKTDYDFYPRQLAEKYEADDKIVMETGKTKRTNETYIRDGKDGNVTGIRCIFRDITAQRQTQKKLLVYQKQLRDLTSEISLAEEHERQRLAIELHDHITQTLVLFKINLSMLLEGKIPAESSESMVTINRDIDQIIQNTRSLTLDLCSPTLYELGIEAAIRKLLNEEVQRKYGIKTEFVSDAQPKPLDNDITVILYRATRELLINVIKHANAQHVTVSIYKEKNEIRINVIDDGDGFICPINNLASDEIEGFGLFSVRERLNSFGGSLEIDSKPGHGTRVTLVMPTKLEKTY
jgi:signal transduction histidine kinase